MLRQNRTRPGLAKSLRGGNQLRVKRSLAGGGGLPDHFRQPVLPQTPFSVYEAPPFLVTF